MFEHGSSIRRLAVVVAACACAVVGAYSAVHVARELPLAIASASWPSVEAVVVHSDERRAGRRSRRFARLEVAFEYRVGGASYTSRRVQFLSNVFTRQGARERLARYAEGARVVAHFLPSDPGVAVLEPGVPAAKAVGAVLGTVLLAGIGGVGLARASDPQ